MLYFKGQSAVLKGNSDVLQRTECCTSKDRVLYLKDTVLSFKGQSDVLQRTQCCTSKDRVLYFKGQSSLSMSAV